MAVKKAANTKEKQQQLPGVSGAFCKILIRNHMGVAATISALSNSALSHASQSYKEEEEEEHTFVKIYASQVLCDKDEVGNEDDDDNHHEDGELSLKKLKNELQKMIPAPAQNLLMMMMLYYRDEDDDLVLVSSNRILSDAFTTTGPKVCMELRIQSSSLLTMNSNRTDVVLMQTKKEREEENLELEKHNLSKQMEQMQFELNQMQQALFVAPTFNNANETNNKMKTLGHLHRRPCQPSPVRLELRLATCCGPKLYPSPQRIYMGQSDNKQNLGLVYWNVSHLVPGRYRLDVLYKGVASPPHPSQQLCVGISFMPSAVIHQNLLQGDPASEGWSNEHYKAYQQCYEQVKVNIVTLPNVQATPWHNLAKWKDMTLGQVVIQGKRGAAATMLTTAKEPADEEEELLVIMLAGKRDAHDFHLVDLTYLD